MRWLSPSAPGMGMLGCSGLGLIYELELVYAVELLYLHFLCLHLS